MSNRNAVSLYFVGQGAAILLWWLLLWLVPDARPYFQIGGSETALLAFWLPDLLLLGAGSLLGSYLCYRQHRFAQDVEDDRVERPAARRGQLIASLGRESCRRFGSR